MLFTQTFIKKLTIALLVFVHIISISLFCLFAHYKVSYNYCSISKFDCQHNSYNTKCFEYD